jgi:ABC-type branched-subunit amino acid transport system ATPase component
MTTATRALVGPDSSGKTPSINILAGGFEKRRRERPEWRRYRKRIKKCRERPIGNKLMLSFFDLDKHKDALFS